MPPTRALAPLALAAVLALAGCGESEKEKQKASKPSGSGQQKVAGPKVSVKILQPTPNEKVGDKAIVGRVQLTGFELNPKAVGQAAQPGEGHLHWVLDGGKFDYPKYSGENGRTAKKLGVEGKYSPSTKPRIRYEGLPKGKHTLEVYLANNDHSNAGPKASVTFTTTK